MPSKTPHHHTVRFVVTADRSGFVTPSWCWWAQPRKDGNLHFYDQPGKERRGIFGTIGLDVFHVTHLVLSFSYGSVAMSGGRLILPKKWFLTLRSKSVTLATALTVKHVDFCDSFEEYKKMQKAFASLLVSH